MYCYDGTHHINSTAVKPLGALLPAIVRGGNEEQGGVLG